MTTKAHGDLENLLTFGVDPKARRIFLHAALEHPSDSEKSTGENPVEHIVRSLIHLGTSSTKPIELWINTPGGCLWEMFGVLDVMNSLDCPIITIGWGSVCSAGGPILVSGTHRFATQHCQMMTHEGTRTYEDMTDRAIDAMREAENKLSGRVYTIMGEKTDKPREFWKKLDLKNPENWLDVDDMKEHGVIDDVYSRQAIRDLGY